ncbi:hypothetical protein MF672_008040 [Actinomadura sp. ATCC 31491]|uniref:Sigma-70 family RNA polymerase sigma factor n=1 Tax=Actinomadura luzonensis TaxID=2805427 RepID=A0ABT0FP98_9ACTN|nr:hypothetical protein [Actinomadura luzonensis]MCK2213736.1 hypothetical protein [Actinomadura luzonensis]
MSANTDRGNELWQKWSTFLERIQLEQALTTARAADQQDEAARLEARLADLPRITSLEALQANADLMAMLGTQRWIAMRIAQEEGASLEQIGRQLGISKQSAWEFMKRRIDEHRNA